MRMTGLFDPARHQALSPANGSWGERTARAAIDRIVASALAEYSPGEGWTAHPLDDPDSPGQRFHNLYFGSGGVIWALQWLQRAGALDRSLPDLSSLIARLVELNRPFLADSQHGSASFLMGEAGLDLLAWTQQPDAALAQRLHDTIRANLHNPANEALWGNPGTLLAAVHLAEATGEARWADLVREAADALLADTVLDADIGTWIWVQNLYGRPPVRYLGAGHGLAGNVFPFLRGAALLPAALVAQAAERALATLQATVVRADGGANWFPGVNSARPAHWLPPVQDCHGAPGIICRLAAAPRTSDWDSLLLEAGELTWHAGPLAKGASICHGTAGSALAMLKLWRRSGDPVWLARARALALHAIGQVEQHRVAYGVGRQSLWTGDLGLACVLWACVAGDDRFPTMDRC